MITRERQSSTCQWQTNNHKHLPRKAVIHVDRKKIYLGYTIAFDTLYMFLPSPTLIDA